MVGEIKQAMMTKAEREKEVYDKGKNTKSF